jgi:hypothetical protein
MQSFVPLDGNFSISKDVNYRYVQLIVNGTYGSEKVGPTVAEFAVL